MISSAVTLSLVPQAKGGPFIFWEDLAAACSEAAKLEFDGIEIFAPSNQALENPALPQILQSHQLKLAAAGTGAGWVLNQLHLSHPDPSVRAGARQFIAQIIDAAGRLGAPAIIGSMQGRAEKEVSRDQALAWLAEGLNELGERAATHQVPLLFEPLNRYETNLINRLEDGVVFLKSLRSTNVKLLADLFHMNIEEKSIPAALTAAAGHIGHVHFVDSNRRPAGQGHLDLPSIARALLRTNFQGYASAEALPYPDPAAAARQTMTAFNQVFRN